MARQEPDPFRARCPNCGDPNCDTCEECGYDKCECVCEEEEADTPEG